MVSDWDSIKIVFSSVQIFSLGPALKRFDVRAAPRLGSGVKCSNCTSVISIFMVPVLW